MAGEHFTKKLVDYSDDEGDSDTEFVESGNKNIQTCLPVKDSGPCGKETCCNEADNCTVTGNVRHNIKSQPFIETKEEECANETNAINVKINSSKENVANLHSMGRNLHAMQKELENVRLVDCEIVKKEPESIADCEDVALLPRVKLESNKESYPDTVCDMFSGILAPKDENGATIDNVEDDSDQDDEDGSNDADEDDSDQDEGDEDEDDDDDNSSIASEVSETSSSFTSSTGSSVNAQDILNQCMEDSDNEFEVPKTKNELLIDELPDEPELKVDLPKDARLDLAGEVQSLVEQMIVIKGIKGCPALDIETIFFKENREPFGKVFDVFGPVPSPFYAIRIRKDDTMESLGLSVGEKIFYAPNYLNVTNYVFLEQLKRMKGSDASWTHDQEPPPHCVEFSDDEEEAKAKSIAKKKRLQERKATGEGTHQQPNDDTASAMERRGHAVCKPPRLMPYPRMNFQPRGNFNEYSSRPPFQPADWNMTLSRAPPPAGSADHTVQMNSLHGNVPVSSEDVTTGPGFPPVGHPERSFDGVQGIPFDNSRPPPQHGYRFPPVQHSGFPPSFDPRMVRPPFPLDHPQRNWRPPF
eukprot:gene11939-13175_t